MFIKAALISATDGLVPGAIELQPFEIEAFIKQCTSDGRRLMFSQNGTRLKWQPTPRKPLLRKVDAKARVFEMRFCADYFSGETFLGKPIEIFPDAVGEWQDPILKLSEQIYYSYVRTCRLCGIAPLLDPDAPRGRRTTLARRT